MASSAGSALAEATSPEVAGDLLVVPLGATEQHGPHLPLGTDTAIAVALAAGLAGATVAPPLAFGASGEHAGFPGTLSIGRAVTELVLVELGRSACETFARLLFVNAHGGNAEPVAAALATLGAEGRDVRAFAPRWGGDAHGGRTETSVMLALAPAQVRLDRAAAGAREPLGALLGRLRAGGVAAVSPNGVLGDPAGASAAEGRALLAAAAEQLQAFVEAW